jgi:hypothetical protein
VQKAIKENTIYKGYRWLFVENGQDPNVVYDIKDNVINTKNIIEHILKLNLNKTEILESFTGIKDLSTKLTKPYKYIKKYVDTNLVYNGFYYLRISQCPENIKNTFNKPLKRFTKKVVQINPFTKEETEYSCVNEICLKLGSTNDVFLEAINKKIMHKGSFWKFKDS